MLRTFPRATLRSASHTGYTARMLGTGGSSLRWLVFLAPRRKRVLIACLPVLLAIAALAPVLLPRSPRQFTLIVHASAGHPEATVLVYAERAATVDPLGEIRTARTLVASQHPDASGTVTFRLPPGQYLIESGGPADGVAGAPRFTRTVRLDRDTQVQGG